MLKVNKAIKKTTDETNRRCVQIQSPNKNPCTHSRHTKQIKNSTKTRLIHVNSLNSTATSEYNCMVLILRFSFPEFWISWQFDLVNFLQDEAKPYPQDSTFWVPRAVTSETINTKKIPKPMEVIRERWKVEFSV